MGRSARVHRIRDGIEDREYFWLMNDLAEQAKSAGQLSGDLAGRIRAANAVPARITFSVGNFGHDSEPMDQARHEMASIIRELTRVIGSDLAATW